jgi:cardiolipin synthase
MDRVRAGVEVRILYDWLSSMPYKKSELRALAEAGATVVPCYRRARQLNYRNHMKMVLIDGRVVFSGGMNMGSEYIDGGSRFATWRDTHFRMTGPVITPYAALFASTWAANGRPEDLLTGYVDADGWSTPQGGTAVQVLHSSVSTTFPAIRDLFIVALTGAADRVWIQTPYFVPDEPLLTAMCVAAAAGVDVRLMITGHPDKKLPYYAAHAYFEHVLRAGVRVYEYDAGFLHAKTVTVDDDVAVIGTCNWDVRSLILHDEVVSVFHDPGVAKTCATQYQLDLEHAHEVTLDQMTALGRWPRTRNSLCRLTSRLL